jgi:hypothetical protein
MNERVQIEIALVALEQGRCPDQTLAGVVEVQPRVPFQLEPDPPAGDLVHIDRVGFLEVRTVEAAPAAR